MLKNLAPSSGIAGKMRASVFSVRWTADYTPSLSQNTRHHVCNRAMNDPSAGLGPSERPMPLSVKSLDSFLGPGYSGFGELEGFLQPHHLPTTLSRTKSCTRTFEDSQLMSRCAARCVL